MPLERLKNKIEEFVAEHLPDEPPKRKNRNKIIHECIWGTQLFDENEIILLDTPLLQRLRRIHQTGFAYYTFPTAVHSRFDHTLGTVTQCSRLAKELQTKQETKQGTLMKDLLIPLRLSALLHDCGHGIFSHTSEELYGLLDEMQEATKEGAEFGDGPKPHEILSSLIVQSEPFKDYIEKVIPECDTKQISEYIIGIADNSSKYKAEILCSIFDGDKIDYIHRDAHFSGLPLEIDLDRLWYGIDIMPITIGGVEYQKLSISHSATEPLEQMMFHRTMLFLTLYQHQKVRACDCMFKGIVEYIRNTGLGVRMGHRTVTFNNIEDFLWGTDDEFFVIGLDSKDTNLRRLMDDLLERRLFHRVLAISSRTIDDPDGPGYADLMKYRDETSPESYRYLRSLAEEICREAVKKRLNVLPEQIWIDLPANVEAGKDAEDAFVHVVTEAAQDKSPDKYEFIRAMEIFPIDRWVRQIEMYKWQGSVFAPPEIQEEIALIAQQVIENRFRFRFKPQAFTECHLVPPKK